MSETDEAAVRKEIENINTFFDILERYEHTFNKQLGIYLKCLNSHSERHPELGICETPESLESKLFPVYKKFRSGDAPSSELASGGTQEVPFLSLNDDAGEFEKYHLSERSGRVAGNFEGNLEMVRGHGGQSGTTALHFSPDGEVKMPFLKSRTEKVYLERELEDGVLEVIEFETLMDHYRTTGYDGYDVVSLSRRPEEGRDIYLVKLKTPGAIYSEPLKIIREECGERKVAIKGLAATADFISSSPKLFIHDRLGLATTNNMIRSYFKWQDAEDKRWDKNAQLRQLKLELEDAGNGNTDNLDFYRDRLDELKDKAGGMTDIKTAIKVFASSPEEASIMLNLLETPTKQANKEKAPEPYQ